MSAWPEAGSRSDSGGGERFLRGARVLLTRPREDGEELAEKIRGAGARAVIVPLIRIGPPENPAALEAARREVSEAGWLVFTSRHAARIFLSGLGAPRGRRPLVAAVGASTREEILRAGWPVDLEGAGRGAAALAIELARRSDVRGATVLHPRSSLARGDLAALLGEAGAVVRDVEAYRTLPAEVGEKESGELRRGDYDLVHFASPSAVRRYVEIVEEAREILARVGAVSIGPTTARALREAGASRLFEAARPDEEGVLAALRAAWIRRKYGRGNTT